MLHLGDKLLALNGHKMTSVEDAITFIDAIPLGEIVSVAIQKEQEVEGKNVQFLEPFTLSTLRSNLDQFQTVSRPFA